MVFKFTISPFLIFSLLMVACKSNEESGTDAPKYDEQLLQRTREAALAIPGDLPVAINYMNYASSIRAWNEVVEGGSADPCTMARTAFQIEFTSGWIMVDAGMDRAVHHFFEKEKPQPFDEAAAGQVAKAVQQSRLILITHEHGDHVAGVIRNPGKEIPSKTILTRQQADALINDPQMPEIRLDEEKSKEYIIASFESILPVAPGVVLIRTPGHTKGEIMIYAKLQNGKEYIFTGDISWSFKGIEENKQKPASERKRVGEDEDLVGQQLAWLQQRLLKDKMIILVSHDDIMLPQYAAQGLITRSVKVNP
jgi:glyoxylase-like metal-dependent hydrolase (beta-lactamase superfamily II)